MAYVWDGGADLDLTYLHLYIWSMVLLWYCRWRLNVTTRRSLIIPPRWTERPLLFRRATKATRLVSLSAKSRRDRRPSPLLSSLFTVAALKTAELSPLLTTNSCRPAILQPSALQMLRRRFAGCWSVVNVRSARQFDGWFLVRWWLNASQQFAAVEFQSSTWKSFAANLLEIYYVPEKLYLHIMRLKIFLQ